MTAVFHSHRKRRKLKSEINVVPYIDVMLVLLVIFMVTAPLLTLSVDVKLPVANAKAVQDREEPIIVIAYPDGRLGLKLPEADIVVMDAAELEARLRPIAEQQGAELRVMVAAQGDAPYQRVLSAMDVLKKAKVKDVGLLTETGGDAG
jgi:biopolymer transport protein TolR